MAFEDYVKAQKSGVKSYRLHVVQGKYPYLPVLDEILSHTEIECETRLGVHEIPLNQVVGTCTSGRTKAFAPNFMPLLDTGSEFSCKWTNLMEAQTEEGIRDPIKVYEYMTNYYVMEGNKRVSVLKYVNAPTIMADVIRKVPKRSDDLANRIYYEYMDFYALTQIDYIRVVKTGRYARLLTALGKNQKDIWDEDERREFSVFYTRFEKAFTEVRKQHLRQVINGDALLFYLNLYPYGQVRTFTSEKIKGDLEKLWSEIVLFGEEDSVALSMNPAEEKTKSSVIDRIKPVKKKKIAFVYDKAIEKSSWIYEHEQGRLHLEKVFGDTVETKVYLADMDRDNGEELLKTVCKNGSNVIFTVTPKMIKACLKAAAEYPDVIILNCALNSPHSTVRTYYARMYEAQFLTGMIAGSLCTNDRVGLVADYPLYGVAAGINAFAMGVKMVNPYAKVYLAWSTVKDFDIDLYFWDQEVSCIFDQNVITAREDMKHYGLYQYVNSEKVDLAVPVHNWGVFYEKILKRIIKGSWKTEVAAENKAINYWWGLSAGVIDVICTDKVPAGTVKLIELMKQNIASGQFHPFTGPLIQQGGRVHYNTSEMMEPKDIMLMDWLVDNVEGHIPTVDELRDEIKPIVMLKGLYAVTADKGGNELL